MEFDFAKEHGDGVIHLASFIRSGQLLIGWNYLQSPGSLHLGWWVPSSDSFYSAHSLTQDKEPSPGWEKIIIPYIYRMFLLLLKCFHIRYLTAGSQHACEVRIIIPILYMGKQGSESL